MNDLPSLKIHRQAGVCTITLDRPEVGNAINEDIRRGLPTLLEQLDEDPGCAAVVLTGAGAKGFCVGADIKESRPIGHPVAERRRLNGNPWIDRVARTRKPLIAAIDGYCLGGGLELALACDIRLATTAAQFGLPETGLGLIPGGGGTQRLSRLVGLGWALDLILSGERIDAAQALRIGLITRMVDEPQGLLPAAEALATRLAARPPAALAFAKEATRQGLEMSLSDGLQLEKSLFAMLMTTEDRAEAARAFKEKRPPHFSGS